MKTRALLILSFLLLLSTACQPTPIDGHVDSGEQNVPTIFMEKFETGIESLEINFDAQVAMPQIDSADTIKTEKMIFSDGIYEKLFHLFAGEQLYYVPEPTKADLEEELLNFKRASLNNGEYDPDEGTKQMIAVLEERIRLAPETQELTPFDIAYDIDGKQRVDNTEITCISIQDGQQVFMRGIKNGNLFQYTSRPQSILQTEEMVQFGEAMPGEPPGSTIGEIDIDIADAKQIGEDLLSQIGLEGMQCGPVTKARLIKLDGTSIYLTGWLLTYVREYDGLLCCDIGNSSSVDRDNPPSRAAPWEMEQLAILVNKNGIQYCSWAGAISLIEGTETKEDILGFNSVLNLAKAQLKRRYAWNEGNSFKRRVNVEKMELGLSNLSVLNEPQYGQLVPTWFVHYTTWEEDPNQEGQEHRFNEVLAIDAVSGTLVEPRMTTQQLMRIFG